MSSPLRLVRDLAALSGGELVSKIAGFAAFAYLARALTPEAYGAVELAVALALFFALIVDFGFGPIGAREIARDPARAPSLAAEVPAARLLLAVLAVPGMGGLALALGQPPETVRVVWLFAASLLLAPWTQRWLLQGLDRMAWVSVAQALRMIVFAVGVVAFVQGPEDLLRVGLVEIAAAATMAGYFVVVQASTVAPVRLSFDRGALGRLWREARSVGASQVVWALNQYLPTVLVALLLGGADIAWFGGAHRIVLSLGTFVWLYHFNLFPSMARTTSRSPAAFQRLVEPSFRVTAWAGVIGALGLGLLAGPLCRVAFGDAFGAAAAPFAVLAWVIPVGLLSGHARYALIASGNQRRELEAQLAGAAVIAIVGLAAIPPLGPLGGAVAMLASALAVWVVAHRATVRHVAPIPFLGPVLRPLAVGGAAAALASWALASPWAAAALMGAVSLAAAPLVDARLLRDLRALAGAKSAAAPAGAAGGER